MKNKYTFAESHDNQNDYKATVGSCQISYFQNINLFNP